MQSPTKLKQRLTDLLGPPGPDADPLELTLRTVVATTAPMVEGFVGAMTPDELDRGLEGVALFFLRIRSDEQPLSIDFLEELGRLNAIAHAGGAVETPVAPAPQQLPAPPIGPVSGGLQQGALPAQASPAEGAPPAPEWPDPADPPAPAPAADPPPAPPSSPSSSEPSSPPSSSPASSEDSPAAGGESESTGSGERPPAPPWPLY